MKKKLYDDSWMYILLLTTLIILTESIKGYTFNYYEDGTANCITPLEKGCRNCLCWDKLDSACKSMIEIAKE